MTAWYFSPYPADLWEPVEVQGQGAAPPTLGLGGSGADRRRRKSAKRSNYAAQLVVDALDLVDHDRLEEAVDMLKKKDPTVEEEKEEEEEEIVVVESDTKRVLFLCEWCLNWQRDEVQLERHKAKCTLHHPPGDEIYRDGALSVFEVDGSRQRVYCENICLMSKLFLEQKDLVLEVAPFAFYVLCICDSVGCHFVGYFSKEVVNLQQRNLACILTLPPYQQLGYGQFLIAFSYELSKRMKCVGSPETPLSDLGKVSYHAYWYRSVMTELRRMKGPVTLLDLAKRTSIRTEDIATVLMEKGVLKMVRGNWALKLTAQILAEHSTSVAKQRVPPLLERRLLWIPEPVPVRRREIPLPDYY